MAIILKGVYRNGRVELLEPAPPHIHDDALVTVEFSVSSKKDESKGTMLRFGMYKGLIEATDEDFKDIKTRWKRRFEEDFGPL